MTLAAIPAAGLRAAEGDGFWANAYPILPHPGELVVGLISFAILYWIFKSKVFPRLEEMFAERAAAIEGGMKEAEVAQAEAKAALQEYQDQLASAHGEAQQIREQARTEGAQILAEMRERAQAEADRITSAAQAQIQAERQQAVVQLRGEVGGMATTLASRIVGESLTDDARASRVIDRFLDELDAQADSRQSPNSVESGS